MNWSVLLLGTECPHQIPIVWPGRYPVTYPGGTEPARRQRAE